MKDKSHKKALWEANKAFREPIGEKDSKAVFAGTVLFFLLFITSTMFLHY